MDALVSRATSTREYSTVDGLSDVQYSKEFGVRVRHLMNHCLSDVMAATHVTLLCLLQGILLTCKKKEMATGLIFTLTDKNRNSLKTNYKAHYKSEMKIIYFLQYTLSVADWMLC